MIVALVGTTDAAALAALVDRVTHDDDADVRVAVLALGRALSDAGEGGKALRCTVARACARWEKAPS